MHSNQQYSFSQVPHANIPRSRFNRSSTLKTTFDTGYLIPIFVDEVLPADTFQLNATLFGRMSTPLVPIMDNLYLDVFFFFVPTRLVWTNFQKFMGQQDNPGDSTSYTIPTLDLTAGTTFANSSIFDYFGLPTDVAIPAANPYPLKISALPFRAYNLIWNEWFRDQNLQNSITISKGDGPDALTGFGIWKRGKRHDYFTSALPWPQKGPGISLPLGTTAQVIVNPAQPYPNFSGIPNVTARHLINNAGSNVVLFSGADVTGAGEAYWTSGADKTGLLADLSTATSATINSLRQAFQLQRLQERDARGGTRYIEIIKAHFGVDSPDARLQRPEYLGGGTTNIQFNPVEQNAITAGQTPLGRLAAYATLGASGIGFTKSFVEHGYIIGLANVRADYTYQQGINRMWTRQTKADFYWPALAHLGEQTILTKELYCLGTAVNDDVVFGYQERYAEYRYKPGQICGRFRSTYATPMDIWHLAQKFTAAPTLGETFIRESPPVDRVVAVNTEPQILLDAYFANFTTRPMPVYSVPGLVDHF